MTGSLLSMPNVIVGTAVTPVVNVFAWFKLPPKLIRWAPFCQFKVSLKVESGLFWRVAVVLAVGFVSEVSALEIAVAVDLKFNAYPF